MIRDTGRIYFGSRVSYIRMRKKFSAKLGFEHKQLVKVSIIDKTIVIESLRKLI